MCIPWFTDRLASNCVFFWFADRLASTCVYSFGLQTGWLVPVCVLLVCQQVGQYLCVFFWFADRLASTYVYSLVYRQVGQYLCVFFWFADRLASTYVYSFGLQTGWPVLTCSLLVWPVHTCILLVYWQGDQNLCVFCLFGQ